MRLPQSSGTSLSIPVLGIVLALSLPVLPSARAATQSLQFSPASLKFGSVTVGQSETQLVDLSNTGQSSVTITAIGGGNSEFSVSGLTLPVVLGAGQMVSFNVVFAPTQNGWTGETMTFTNNSSAPNLRLTVVGTGVSSEHLTAAPARLSFGQVAVGASSTLPVVLTNAVSWKITLSAIQTFGSGFSASGLTFPVVLSPGQSVSLKVAFAPQFAGVEGGSVFISGPGLNIPLSGTGTAIGQLSVSPAALNFGSVDVGSSTTQPASMTATGGSVTVSSAASNSSQYSIAGASFPLTINAGQSLGFNVVFAPTKTGTANGTLTFNSNASNSQTAESLTGSGITPQYNVNLSWTGSTSSVVGYNVYRGTTAGSYSKINTALDPGTSYSDGTVTSGATYYYAATAVNSAGEESSYSTPIEVSIP
jgi:hypothetical protein